MRISLEQKTILNMVMTTELRQAIEILQLSTYELREFIQEEAEQNALIELIEEKPMDSSDLYQNVQDRSIENDSPDSIDYGLIHEKTIHEYLLEQLVGFRLHKQVEELARYIILNINEKGFLTTYVEEISGIFNVKKEFIKEALYVVQELEPIGIGARDIVECLSIQAKKMYPNDDLLLTVITKHLQDLADRKWKFIAKELQIPLSKVQDVFEKIQHFNPHPGTLFSSSQTNYLEPDIYIIRIRNSNKFNIYLNESSLPELKFNDTYLNGHERSQEVSRYVNESFKRFQWLKNSIEQRRNTILKIMQVVVAKQQEYLI